MGCDCWREHGSPEHVEARTQIGHSAPEYEAEDQVEDTVTNAAQERVALDSRATHEAGAKTGVVAAMCSIREERQNIGYPTLVVSVEHNHVREPSRLGVREGRLVRAAEVEILPILRNRHAPFAHALECLGRDSNRSISAAVVQDQDLLEHHARHLAELLEYPTDLTLAVEARNDYEDTVAHGRAPLRQTWFRISCSARARSFSPALAFSSYCAASSAKLADSGAMSDALNRITISGS